MLNQTPLVRMTSELPPSTREPGRRGKQGETRARLINGLEMLQNKRDSNPAKKHGNIPL